jgi:hypothetical protein
MQHVKLVLVGASGEIMTELMVALRPLSNEFAANPELDQTGDNAFQPLCVFPPFPYHVKPADIDFQSLN